MKKGKEKREPNDQVKVPFCFKSTLKITQNDEIVKLRCWNG